VGKHGLANGTRPHPELGVLSRFRMTGQMFAETTLVHVMFTAHRARMIGSAAFRHVWTGTDVGVGYWWGKKTSKKASLNKL